MDKYIIISDISKCPCYRNVNARLLYLHIACCVDTSTYNYCQSFRQLALETGMSVDAVRHAVKQLERDRLITTHVAPHSPTQYAPQHTPQPTTHLHIVTIKDLGTPNGTPNITPNTTPCTTPCTTAYTTHKKKLNNITYTHTHAQAMREGLIETLSGCLKISNDESSVFFDLWYERQSIKGKTWSSEGDMTAHLLSWAEKRIPKKRVTKIDETKARAEEYARTVEEATKVTEEEKNIEEVARLKRWLAEAQRKGESERVTIFKNALKRLQK